MKTLRSFLEWQAFGVCSTLAQRLRISTARVRLWFIYISFLTLGSPMIVYFIMAFILNIRNYIQSALRNPVRWF
ncbi:MAG TPA: PspC domain-containing protein [Chitinophagaceae bacterium]|nr:PspC domain-containing protein [Chitinophagaceae bacterium]